MGGGWICSTDTQIHSEETKAQHRVMATTYLFLTEYSVLFCADKQQEINKKQAMYCYEQPKPFTKRGQERQMESIDYHFIPTKS